MVKTEVSGQFRFSILPPPFTFYVLLCYFYVVFGLLYWNWGARITPFTCISACPHSLLKKANKQDSRCWPLQGASLKLKCRNDDFFSFCFCVSFLQKLPYDPWCGSLSRVFDVESGECLHTLLGHTAEIVSLNFDTNGQRIMTGSFDHTVKGRRASFVLYYAGSAVRSSDKPHCSNLSARFIQTQ